MQIIALVTRAKQRIGSSKALADYLGLERHCVSTWLSGKHMPRPKHIIAMNILLFKGDVYVA